MWGATGLGEEEVTRSPEDLPSSGQGAIQIKRENVLPSCPLAASLPPLVFLRPPSGALPLGAPSVPWGGIIMNVIPTGPLFSRPGEACISDTGPSAQELLIQSPEPGWGGEGAAREGSATCHSLDWGRHAFCLVAWHPGIAPSLPLGPELLLPPILATSEGSSCSGEKQLLGVGCGLVKLPLSVPGRVPSLPPAPQDRDGPCPSLCARLTARDCTGNAVLSRACLCSGPRGMLLWCVVVVVNVP